MNKLLLLAFSAFATASISAQTPQLAKPELGKRHHNLTVLDQQAQSPQKAASRDSEDAYYDLNMVGDIYNYTYIQASGDYRIYQHIPADLATRMAGNTLTDIYYSVALMASGSLPGTIFVTENPGGDDVTTTDITLTDCLSGGDTGDYYRRAALKEPYTIKEGQEFYFGFTVKGCVYSSSGSSDVPLAFDGEEPGDFAGILEFTSQGQTTYFDFGEAAGSNLCLKARLFGKGLPNYFLLMPTGFTDSFAYPLVEDAQSANAWVYVYNKGSNAITSMTYEYSVNGSASETKTISLDIESGAQGYIEVPFTNLQYGVNYVELEVTEANGMAVNNAEVFKIYNFAPNATRYTRKMVVEEGTGTWCGYCPRGIVGMDYMENKYPDEFIGIAVHVSSSTTDPLQANSYLPFAYEYFSSFPGSVTNREPYYNVDPHFDNLEMVKGEFDGIPSYVKLSLEGYYPEAKSATITLNSQFSQDEEDANYLVAFVVLEDGLTARQTNYYANNAAIDPNGYAGDWVNKSSSYRWTYTNTARDIFDPFGIEGLIPASIQAGKEYTAEYTVDLSNVKKVENSSIVAMVLDGETGVILNAEKISYEALLGVNDVFMPGETDCEVGSANGAIIINGTYTNAQAYSLSGQCVGMEGLAPGIYLVNVDGKAHKVIVK